MSKGRLLSILIKPLLALHLIYLVFHNLPGSPLAFETSLRQNYQDFLIEKFKLDQGFWHQYVSFLESVFTWNWGYSISEYPRTVSEVFLNALGPTMQIGIIAIVVVAFCSLSLVFFANLCSNGKMVPKLERLISFLQGVPVIFLAPFLIYVFAITLGWLPVALLESSWAYILPVLSLSFRPLLVSTRLLLQEISRLNESEIVRTARAKGLPPQQILTTHLFKLASPVFIASLFNSSIAILGGSVLIEVLFGINGVGSLFLKTLEQRDAPMAMAVASFYCASYFILSFFYETGLRLLDPRVADLEGASK